MAIVTISFFGSIYRHTGAWMREEARLVGSSGFGASNILAQAAETQPTGLGSNFVFVPTLFLV